jgi:uncharacterized membrane protein YeaQ/YmgE (transglycosylase-associated protein family)
MTLPTVFFGFVLATIFGAGFHVWQGGGARRLLLYLLAGWLGFVLGHLAAEAFEIRLLMVGALNIVPATLGSVLALFAAKLFAPNRQMEENE